MKVSVLRRVESAARLLMAVVLPFAFFVQNAVASVETGTLGQGCDSCLFQITNLDRPYSLTGRWLFTRDDKPDNRLSELDTSAWKTVMAPGPWKPAYDDGKAYSVGWYRATLAFAPELVGQEVLFLVDAFMGRVNFYLDGQEIYRRPGEISISRYYSIQPIPIRFRITKTTHVVAFRVDTPLMKGVYQLPFDLRKYKDSDFSLYAYQFAGGEARLIASYVALFFGLFFLVVYAKTRYALYLVAGLNCLIVIPYFAFPGDNLLRLFPPEPLFYLHYIGLCVAWTSYMFAQFFYRFTPRLNWVLGIACLVSSGLIVSNIFHPDLELFVRVRSVHLLMLLGILLGGLYLTLRAAQQGKPGARILMLGIATFSTTAIHDTLLALGLINSIGLLFIGVLALTASTFVAASSIFANTFLENRDLVQTLTIMNNNLEGLVSERTKKLGDAMADLGAANLNLRSSYEELSRAKDELVRNEKLAALGSLVAGVAHELNTPLGNGLMAASSLVAQMQALKQEIAEKGARRSSFEEFLKSAEDAMDITLRSLNRSASLVSSFKQIAADQNNAPRGHFILNTLFNDVASLVEPSLEGKPVRLIMSPIDGVELDSFSGPLSEVLINLISNAVTHGLEGRSQGTIRLYAELGDDENVIIHVQDDGHGIADEHLSRIFDPFFTTRLGQGGSGLGLHIVHNIVTLILGGSLDVKTEVGKGSDFIIDIPLTAPVTVPSAKVA